MSHAWTHSWCKSPCRDEAVRAAEDGRSGPLPTLEEAIATITQKGNDMGTKAEIQAKAYRAEERKLEAESRRKADVRSGSTWFPASEQPAPAPPAPPTTKTATVENDFAAVTDRRPVQPGGGGNVTGLRTERVSLSLKRMGELIEERDAAIRERDEWRDDYRHCRAANTLVCDERDTLKNRVAELEEQLESVADRAATAENRVAELESAAKLAPAANADGGSNHAAPAASGAAGAEPDAWGVRWDGQTEIDCEFVYNNSSGVHELLANNSGSGTVVPLYAAPQPAPGWLTEEERRSIQHAANLAKASWSYSVAQELENILTRSSPPEVVLPVCEFTRLSTHMMGFLEAIGRVKKALAAAGVTVKEVGE